MLVAQSCPTLCNPVDCNLPGFSVHGTLGKNTGVGCQSVLQGIFLTQGSNPVFLNCRQILYRLSQQGSPLKAGGKMNLLCDDLQIANHLMFLHKKNISFSPVLLVAGKDLVQRSYILSLLFPLWWVSDIGEWLPWVKYTDSDSGREQSFLGNQTFSLAFVSTLL